MEGHWCGASVELCSRLLAQERGQEKNQGIRIVIYLAIKVGTSGRKVAEEECKVMNGGSQHQNTW